MGHVVRQKFAWTILGPLVLLGMLSMDVLMDQGPPETIAAYYTHLINLQGPLAALLPCIIVVGFTPLILRLRAMRTLDLVTFLLCASAIAILIVALTPMETQVAAGIEDAEELARLLADIKTYHLVVLPLMVTSVALQIMSHREIVNSKQRPE